MTWQSSPITNLSAGTYLIDVKDNSNGCIETDQIAGGVVISEPALPLAIGVETISNISCHGLGDGSIDLTGNVTGVITSYSIHYTKLYDVVFRDDGSFTEVDLGVSDNPHQINLNSYGFEDLDMS